MTTAETHPHHLFVKVGVADRTEPAAAVPDRGCREQQSQT
jgi:hypothetical protein